MGLGTVHYLYPRGVGKMEGGHVKFILSYGGGGYLLFWSPEGGCRKNPENIVAPVYI